MYSLFLQPSTLADFVQSVRLGP